MKPMELAAIMALTDAGKHASRLENQTSASPISALRSSFLPGEGGNHARYDNEYFTARFLEAEQMVDAVIAILDGPDVDAGTCVEIGYAYANKKPIIGVRTDFRASEDKGVNLMVSKACSELIWLQDNSVGLEYVLDELVRAVRNYLAKFSSLEKT